MCGSGGGAPFRTQTHTRSRFTKLDVFFVFVGVVARVVLFIIIIKQTHFAVVDTKF